LIRRNNTRLGKELVAANNIEGEKIYIRTLPTDWTEAKFIVDNADKNSAILIRAGNLSRVLEEEFNSRGITYKLVGATKFYDRMEIRDAIAYARLLTHTFDDLSFIRIISKPRRGFGEGAIAKLREFGGSLFDALKSMTLPARQRANADEFLRAFDFDWGKLSPSTALSQLLENSGYLKMWRESKDIDADERLKNINELLSNVVSKYETMDEFLEHAALMMTDDDGAENEFNAIPIMTIHAAKGLEFDNIFLPGWEQGIFPNEMSLNEGGLEEERRLAYVAITRAKKRVTITNTISRSIYGQKQYNTPSQFINEIDKEFKDTPTQDFVRGRAANKIFPAPQGGRKETQVGKLARHIEMGQGVIIEESGDILTIAFRNFGVKKVSKKFLDF
jgi:DNA helicase-2/ATP-dependent DNA helicase PcrA